MALKWEEWGDMGHKLMEYPTPSATGSDTYYRVQWWEYEWVAFALGVPHAPPVPFASVDEAKQFAESTYILESSNGA